jgi:two-component system sensor kinase FixL
MQQREKRSLADVLSKQLSDDGERIDASAHLAAFLDATPDVFIIIDHSGKIEVVNAAVSKMFGYKPETLLGKNISLLMPTSLKKAHNGYLSAYLLRGLKANGDEFPILLSVGVVNDASQTQFVGIISDITEQETAKTALAKSNSQLVFAERLSSIGEMSARIAHEINQPLAAILSYAQASIRMLNATGEDHLKTISETLEKICEQAIRANQIVSRQGALARRNGLKRSNVRFVPFMKETLHLANIDARLVKYKVEFNNELDEAVEVFIDPVQIQQVVLNILRNALDAMEGTNETLIQLQCRWKSSNEIEVSILDCGTGVTKENRNRLFSPFFTTKNNGMGIGLSICQSIIHDHGGHIYYCARQPIGSKFSFILPCLTHNDQPKGT